MRSAPRSRFLFPAGVRITLSAAALASPLAQAQTTATPAEPSVQLRPSPALAEPLPQETKQGPTFVFGERVSGQADVRTIVEGQAELRRAGTSVRADRLDLEQSQQLLTTSGQVRVQQQGNLFTGSELQLRLDTFEGFFTQPQFQLRSGGSGQAQRIDFLGEDRMVAHQATYTTCQRNNEDSWKPAWELRAERFYFDMGAEVGEAYKPVIRFKDVPILGWGGSVSFPLSDKRKSGFLPPSYTVDTASGLGLTLPYYLDIAPNRDATLTPKLMSKRGLNLGSEFRYIDRDYQGLWRANFLPNDQLLGTDRWSYNLVHASRWPTTVAGGQLNYNFNLNRVSDNTYWRDFPGQQAGVLTQRLLPSTFSMGWGRGPWSVGVQTLSWQTLQTADSTLVPPYDRLPQITARYGLADVPVGGLGGFDWSVDTDFTRFQAWRAFTNQPNADRLIGRAQISRPWVSAAAFVTPKLQLHATQYNFSEEWNQTRTASRVVPTFSLDSGLQFERQAGFFGRSFVQTLEPRAFYVYTPFRDQTGLPNYDSAQNSFTFASVFTENSFLGNDRIADANLLTLGLSSRLLSPETGAENVRLGMAQRIRFSGQQVTLSGDPTTADSQRFSDLLFGGTVNWTQSWATTVFSQYNPNLGRSQRSSLSARYSPTPYRVVTASYKRQQPLTATDAGSQQMDVAWQWPLNDLWGDRGQDLGRGQGLGGRRWYSVGRLNYSMVDRKLVDGVLGVEYDGCCWIGRLVVKRSTLGVNSNNLQIMAQLEFVGFSRIGNNPLSALRTNVPRYQLLREQVDLPSRFTNYE